MISFPGSLLLCAAPAHVAQILIAEVYLIGERNNNDVRSRYVERGKAQKCTPAGPISEMGARASSLLHVNGGDAVGAELQVQDAIRRQRQARAAGGRITPDRLMGGGVDAVDGRVSADEQNVLRQERLRECSSRLR